MMIDRLKKFGLEIVEDKSRILPFGRYKETKETRLEKAKCQGIATQPDARKHTEYDESPKSETDWELSLSCFGAGMVAALTWLLGGEHVTPTNNHNSCVNPCNHSPTRFTQILHNLHIPAGAIHCK